MQDQNNTGAIIHRPFLTTVICKILVAINANIHLDGKQLVWRREDPFLENEY